MKRQIFLGICISMLIIGWAQAADNSGRNSHFWLTLKPLAGNDTEVWSDMVLANGYRSVDLYSPDLACTRVNKGSTVVYTVIWTGNSFLGDNGMDILRFDRQKHNLRRFGQPVGSGRDMNNGQLFFKQIDPFSTNIADMDRAFGKTAGNSLGQGKAHVPAADESYILHDENVVQGC